ncbi:endoplasmic reticulum oxidoreductin 1 family protein [Cryptosporidium muris RN66]|uniref:Endoplasmic reticulum oxidoreductin 1 family protein n=1 Tax=Cryptosporidium muris (strain RN66) TaxID=441375 RepID=B6AC15_CRYMR|nr:endoplasmic reticulum oxidoreductin 1 family protein [Cryptosporidium muris RN66]EEA05368.1 endoplasmic reticulum oxidoreductin 1 family protein [Cryptosporidium muris RN66]|eukprot:XP_002139717.1 endoplasmic reticulum oxidoreductin 1 family protein [Cryptosporidium muris RN66]
MLIANHVFAFIWFIWRCTIDGNISFIFKAINSNGYRPLVSSEFTPTTEELFNDAYMVQYYMRGIKEHKSIRFFMLDMSPECPKFQGNNSSFAMCHEQEKCQINDCDDSGLNQIFGGIVTQYSALNSKTGKSSSCEEELTLIDMAINPPCNTDYQGGEIWKVVYSELYKVNNSRLEEMISGMQSNIAIHASNRYYKTKDGQYQYSLTNFINKFAKFDNRGSNLLKTFYYVLRGVCILGPTIINYINTLDSNSTDISLKQEISQLVNPKLYYSCKDEYINKDIENIQNIQAMRNFFELLIRMLGCVECEKCVLHGTIKGTTLKLTSNTFNKKTVPEKLQSLDLFALINGLDIFTESITVIDKFAMRVKCGIFILSLFLFVLIFIIYLFTSPTKTNFFKILRSNFKKKVE